MVGKVSNTILANTASDYSKVFRKQLVGTSLFPRSEVTRATGKYVKFKRDDLHYVPDAELATSKSKAAEVEQTHTNQEFACLSYALKEAVANADIEKADGPYPRVIRRTIERLTGKLELAQEKRVAELVVATTGTTLSGDGDAKTNQWDNAGAPGGKPLAVITENLDAMTIRGNTVIIPRSVWNKIQFHSDLINKLPTTAYQTLTSQALCVIFGVDRVLIANGAIKTKKTGPIDSIWGNNVVLAFVDGTGDPDMPTAGRTIINEYAAGSIDGWIAREWQDNEVGLTGGTYYQVGHEVDELIVAPELLHVIKDVI